MPNFLGNVGFCWEDQMDVIKAVSDLTHFTTIFVNNLVLNFATVLLWRGLT